VRGIHTINGGSHPHLVLYIFCVSTSYYSCLTIIDHLLYQHKVLGITTNPPIRLYVTAYIRPKQIGSSENYWFHAVSSLGVRSLSHTPFSSLYTLSMLATLVGFVVTCCRVFIENWPAMNLVMQRRATLQSGESNHWKCLLVIPTERN